MNGAAKEPWFVTGAGGCIGAWVVRELLARGAMPVAFDLRRDDTRLRQVLDSATDLDAVEWIEGDVADPRAVLSALERSRARRVIHLAGLQVPFCAADPVQGARVNVIGTLAVFEAARAAGIGRIAYASSAAVYGRDPDAQASKDAREDEAVAPRTHYGVYKLANEGNARVYWETHGIASIGLRPLTVYGVARDRGLTSGPTKAIKAAVTGHQYRVRFRGTTDFLYTADAARAFVAAADCALDGARIYNLPGEAVSVEHFLGCVAKAVPGCAARISCEGGPLAIAGKLDGVALDAALPGLPRTSLMSGVTATAARFRALHAVGALPLDDLDD